MLQHTRAVCSTHVNRLFPVSLQAGILTYPEARVSCGAIVNHSNAWTSIFLLVALLHANSLMSSCPGSSALPLPPPLRSKHVNWFSAFPLHIGARASNNTASPWTPISCGFSHQTSPHCVPCPLSAMEKSEQTSVISWPMLSYAAEHQCGRVYSITGIQNILPRLFMETFSFCIPGKEDRDVEGNVGNCMRGWCFESCRALRGHAFFSLLPRSHASPNTVWATWAGMRPGEDLANRGNSLRP
jgi:hypothetical protein